MIDIFFCCLNMFSWVARSLQLCSLSWPSYLFAWGQARF